MKSLPPDHIEPKRYENMQAYQDLEVSRRRQNAVLKPTSVQIEKELEVFSQLMDNRFRVPVLGWRFGLNAIIDLIPPENVRPILERFEPEQVREILLTTA